MKIPELEKILFAYLYEKDKGKKQIALEALLTELVEKAL